ncbi:MAG: hypothetical protein ABSE49_12155 [Polyangiaceae bacterium]
MGRLVAWGITLASSWAMASGCGETASRAPTIPTSGTASGAAHATTAASAASGVASAWPVEPVADAAPPAAGVAHGTIACGKATCKGGTEKCCADGTCAALDEGNVPQLCASGPAYRCDGRDDCASGEVCCAEMVASGSDDFTTVCSKAPCMLNEACRGASGCAAGFACKASAKAVEPGKCALTAPTSRCGAAVCSGAKPVCRWSPDRKSGVCVAGSAPAPSGKQVDARCASSADCGGESCCMGALGNSYCFGSCINAATVCETAAECGPDPMGGKRKGCVATSAVASAPWRDAPPWLKVCDYSN